LPADAFNARAAIEAFTHLLWLRIRHGDVPLPSPREYRGADRPSSSRDLASLREGACQSMARQGLAAEFDSMVIAARLQSTYR
jgi:hypothetical protein